MLPRAYENYDEIKRKLRELKKLEIKVRYQDASTQVKQFNKQNNKNPYMNTKSKNSLREAEKADLVWNNFFDLKDDSSNNVKYSIKNLSLMTKEEFKEVINEYFYHMYYKHYKESGLSDISLIVIEKLTQLGLPIYANSNDIKRRFRELVKTYHPDNGGDSASFIEFMEQFKDI